MLWEKPIHIFKGISTWWFQNFMFTLAWGNDPLWRAFFSNGLVQSPTRYLPPPPSWVLEAHLLGLSRCQRSTLWSIPQRDGWLPGDFIPFECPVFASLFLFFFFLGGWMATQKIKIQWNQWVHNLYSFCMIVLYNAYSISLYVYSCIHIYIYLYTTTINERNIGGPFFLGAKHVGHSGLSDATLGWGSIMIMTDQDHDGSHIKEPPRENFNEFARHGNFHNRKKNRDIYQMFFAVCGIKLG